MNKIITHNLEETERVAREFAQNLQAGDVVALIGDLGSGKTTFTQFVAREMGAIAIVNSPTFLIQKEYRLKNERGIEMLYHLDLYRLENERQVEEVGLKEILLDEKGITFIEWPEKADAFMPKDSYKIIFAHVDDTTREIEIT